VAQQSGLRQDGPAADLGPVVLFIYLNVFDGASQRRPAQLGFNVSVCD
jgi:hypothetical protein